jgi:hypothetical protein
MTKVNNTFFMLDYHPFFSFSTHRGCDVRKKECDALARLNCIYRAAKTNDSIPCAKHPLCRSRTTVLLKILVSGPYKGNLRYFHTILIFGWSG